MFLEISFINIILWFFVGLSVSYYARLDDKRGFTPTSVFSILGAETGGYLTSFLTGRSMHALSLEGLIFAALGALVLATFYRFSFYSENTYAD